ncbi:glycosyltransferase family 2 protein [Desulfogranum japonicum]|uniref:glycosyltransferase family 2 protein n=1 Tax=Desulfogranum japonicum TaxID=231447 RepID=UPI00040AE837|nr:glycosyltransferase family 2 protein [Desulfogranum japonicum]
MRSLSIVIPFYNEEENVLTILNEVRSYQPQAEIIAVDDGSTDRTWELICSHEHSKGMRMTHNQGQSAALLAGLKKAQGDIVVMMDGDGQNDPADIAIFLEKMEQEKVDVVCGYRLLRQDAFSKRLASRIGNSIRRFILHDTLQDTGCSLKACRHEAIDHLIAFNGIHRYLGAFFESAGFSICEVPTNHRPRLCGTSKYSNWDRALRGLYDLIGVRWYLKRMVNPLAIREHK